MAEILVIRADASIRMQVEAVLIILLPLLH